MVALVVLVAGLAYWWLAKPTQVAQTPSAAVPVELAEVRQQDVPVELRSLGRVRALRSVDIRAQVEGTLLELPVAEGERVRRGACWRASTIAAMQPRCARPRPNCRSLAPN